MLIDELKKIAKESGIVGAGGAGFPSYAKMTDKADTVILNCVECEPLLKLHKQLLASHAEEIVRMLDEVRETFGAEEAVIGIKNEHRHTIQILEEVLKDYDKVRICAVRPTYPMGDEVILIYEATGRVIKPGGLPIDEHVVVYNTETMYNLYRAVHLGKPVTDKLVTIVGEIENPVTVNIPIGTTVGEAVSLAGKITVRNPAFIMGGPMMGRPGTANTVITKTTNAIIILSEDHKVVMRMNKNLELERRKAASSCCQCRTCTEMCPRHALGHPIEPHRIMRAAANHDTSDLSVYMNTAYCSSCGLCENYACPQGLSPRSVIAEFKNGLRAAGIRGEKPEIADVVSDRELKKVPVTRLKARLGLMEYDVPAPLTDKAPNVKRVRILMSQHIGAPARPSAAEGSTVKKGQKIADASEGLSVAIHASIDGIVEKVSEKEIVISAGKA
ncbi:MAG: 4Fe-4S dicluster domain-containing protein [Blautia sp.]|nr:4Fe-4S dicluster domain-containing protein [Blautia sp.]MCM1200019.1 4Fe-4S dicluster domain-containing protein [Bacteroides fragilis]